MRVLHEYIWLLGTFLICYDFLNLFSFFFNLSSTGLDPTLLRTFHTFSQISACHTIFTSKFKIKILLHLYKNDDNNNSNV